VTTPTIADLEGATLDDVTVDWRNGIALISFLPPPKVGQACVIRATDFTRVEVPRGGVGASRVVKAASHDGRVTVITMDSGETLRVESDAFALDVHGG
jgi:hypothetical protein